MRIIYLSPATNTPIGGIKVFYKHAELLKTNGLNSCVYHPEQPNFVCNWFNHNATIDHTHENKKWFFNKKPNEGEYFKNLDAKNDFVVIPEIWAARFSKYCYELKIPYAIYVQNGYLINAEQPHSDFFEIKNAYDHAALIMSISEDSSKMISVSYPKLSKEKIIRLFPHVSDLFHRSNKEKLITYMPRKLSEHSKKIAFYLKEHLSNDWRLQAIDQMTENETAGLLARSSIFLSFCDQEGCPLPPLEASFSGNLVIGYSGQGANEYFTKPNFILINNGDFFNFIEEVSSAIKSVEAGLLDDPEFLAGIATLKSKYSERNEVAHLLNFASRVAKILEESQG